MARALHTTICVKQTLDGDPLAPLYRLYRMAGIAAELLLSSMSAHFWQMFDMQPEHKKQLLALLVWQLSIPFLCMETSLGSVPVSVRARVGFVYQIAVYFISVDHWSN